MASAPTRKLRLDVIFRLRDAEGLNIYEYAFLLTVESRGYLFTARDRTYEDMRMSKSTYYKTFDSLKTKGLIDVQERYVSRLGKNLPTRISVNKSEVMKLPVRDYSSPRKLAKSGRKLKKRSARRTTESLSRKRRSARRDSK